MKIPLYAPRTPGKLFLTFFACFPLFYAGISALVATILLHAIPKPIRKTPASLGLSYRSVTFLSRGDRLKLQGWFIPGILPDGNLTTTHALILLHGMHSNRASPLLLNLSKELAQKGFALLLFDMRGHGTSQRAPLSGGHFEQRDVLGAVDFLRTGPLPYPELGHPEMIGGWGASMGGATMLLAAAQEPALQAVVTDSAFAMLLPLIKQKFRMPRFLTSSILLAASLLYRVNYHWARPMDVVATIAPRPVFLIHGAADTVVPPEHMNFLVDASGESKRYVQTWLIPEAQHIKAFHVMKDHYVDRLTAFFSGSFWHSK
jgi:fermentation-respiration switch protein FrsA (DUF1100 family)